MKLLALEDLKEMDEAKIKHHIAVEYGKNENYSTPDDEVLKRLKSLNILIAYESVGSWGCDSSSFFLFKEKKTGKLFEMSGSHCSCYGFENQFELSETTVEALKMRAENGIFYTGGYDNNEEGNKEQVKQFVLKMKT